MRDTATTTPAWLPALKHVPDRWYVQSAHSPGSSMLSIAFDQADAERIVADMHARGYRARVVRERVTREIIETAERQRSAMPERRRSMKGGRFPGIGSGGLLARLFITRNHRPILNQPDESL